jgi:TolB-like protein/class 3 adenylate cyclase
MMVIGEFERRLLAIVAADVVGYSRMMEMDEAGTISRLKAVRAEVTDPLVARHHGRIVKLMGDGAIAVFDSVVDAVCCAMAIQTSMMTRNVDVPDGERIVFRIGVNLGDVVLVDDDVYGDGVNIAARLEQLCSPGGVTVSGTAYDHLQGKIDFDFDFTGEHHVKNINRLIRVYSARLHGRAGKNWWIRRRATRLTLASGAIFVMMLAAGGTWWIWSHQQEPVSDKPSVAILAFDNFSGNEADARLADGITEDIITDLSRFRDLDVIARNSTFAYKGKPVDIRQVGRDLGVTYILEGSLGREAGQVRITAQLINSRNGIHIWADRWERAAEDVFQVQTEVAERVASTLGGWGVVHQAGITAAKRKRPTELSAYETYLLGAEMLNRFTKDSVEQSISYFRLALDQDPLLVRAWVKLAFAYSHRSAWNVEPEVSKRIMLEAARHAVELDPADAEAQSALGEALGYTGDTGQAEIAFERAVTLNPKSADMLALYAGWAPRFGKSDRGVEAADHARRLNPTWPIWYNNMFRRAYFFGGRPEDVLAAVNRKPNETRNYNDFVYAAAGSVMLGRMDEAAVWRERAVGSRADISAEWFCKRDGFGEGDRCEKLVNAMTVAGFQLCTSAEEAASWEVGQRLRECENRSQEQGSIQQVQ